MIRGKFLIYKRLQFYWQNGNANSLIIRVPYQNDRIHWYEALDIIQHYMDFLNTDEDACNIFESSFHVRVSSASHTILNICP